MTRNRERLGRSPRQLAADSGAENVEGAPLEKPDLLASPRLAVLLEAADRVFDHVIVDCPALLPAADVVVTQDLLDGLVFVVRSRHSSTKTIQEAISVLRPEALAGVLNAHGDVPVSYRGCARRPDEKT
jgi:Mrp family chromosome partitioning ATPase